MLVPPSIVQATGLRVVPSDDDLPRVSTAILEPVRIHISVRL